VLTSGIVSEWGLDKAISVSLRGQKSAGLFLAEGVREEVEENLLLHAQRLSLPEADELIENYRGLIQLTMPESIPHPDADLVQANRHLIRHASDVPYCFRRWRLSQTGC